jgi:hypothetical protein
MRSIGFVKNQADAILNMGFDPLACLKRGGQEHSGLTGRSASCAKYVLPN